MARGTFLGNVDMSHINDDYGDVDSPRPPQHSSGWGDDDDDSWRDSRGGDSRRQRGYGRGGDSRYRYGDGGGGRGYNKRRQQRGSYDTHSNSPTYRPSSRASPTHRQSSPAYRPSPRYRSSSPTYRTITSKEADVRSRSLSPVDSKRTSTGSDMMDDSERNAFEEAKALLTDLVKLTDVTSISRDLLGWEPPTPSAAAAAASSSRDDGRMEDEDELDFSFAFDHTKDWKTLEEQARRNKRLVEELPHGKNKASKMLKTSLLYLEVIALLEVNGGNPHTISEYIQQIRKLLETYITGVNDDFPVLSVLLQSFSAVLLARRVTIYQGKIKEQSKSLFNTVDTIIRASSGGGGAKQPPKEMSSLTDRLKDVCWLLDRQRCVCETIEASSRLSERIHILSDNSDVRNAFDCIPIFCPRPDTFMNWAYSTSRLVADLNL